MGRIGLAISPVRPRRGLRHRRGAARRGRHLPLAPTAARTGRSAATTCRSRPQYYNELVADPVDVDRVYSMDTFLQVSDDGGKTLATARREVTSTSTTTPCGSTRATPTTCSSAATAASTRAGTAAPTGTSRPTCRSPSSTTSPSTTPRPFYNVYGGTQDNNTLGGPSRTLDPERHRQRRLVRHRAATASSPQIEPGNPDIVYAAVAARRPRPLRPQERREPRHPAAAEAPASRRCAGTGTRRCSSARTRRPGSTSPPTALPQRRPRRQLARGLAATSPARSTATSCR